MFWTWVIFITAIVLSLVFDLRMHAKKSNALGWSLFWVLLSLGFNAWIWAAFGDEAALQFFTCYLVEKSLSVDNLFVFLVIFKAFQTPPKLRHKVLFWGVIGAMLMRALFILGGIALVHRFSFIFYIFGLFLIYTGLKLAFQKEKEIAPEQNPFILLFKRWMPVYMDYSSPHFFLKHEGIWYATPLFLSLLAVEITDLVFAIDSIPAVLGITLNPMIAFTSNIFAVLGLRSLYFVLEQSLEYFQYLHHALAVILIFIGFKMLLADFWHIPISSSLIFIILTLLIALGASLLFKPKK